MPRLRTEFSRTRQLAGGVLETTLSSRPLNFKDASGQWRPIDNDLVRAADGSLENRASGVEIAIPRTAAGNVRFSDGGRSVSFSLVGADATVAEVDGAEAEFEDAVEGVDVGYEAQGAVLKETLTLASPDAPAAYRFDIDAGGLRPELTLSGGVGFVDDAGRRRLGFAAPWMKDADGVVSRAARYELSEDRDQVVLRLDQEWLRDPERRFPVVVDPTVYSSMDHVCEISSGLRSNTTSCDGALSELWVGRDPSGVVHRGLFALEDLADVVPPYVQVLDSWFELDLSGQNPVEPSDVDLHHLTRGFAPGATWNRTDGRTPWSRQGGDYDPERIHRVSTGDADDGWLALDMTELAQTLVARADPSPNLLFKAADETRTHIDAFDRAEVKIRWSHRTGISPLYTYETLDLSDGSTLSMNVANGNIVLASDDINLESDDGLFTVGRYFNSWNLADGETTGSFGRGSRGDFGSIRLEYYWLNGSYVFSGPGAQTGVFQKQPDGSFTPPPGVDAVLTKLPGGAATIFFNDTTETWTFDTDGRLIQTRQDYGYTIDGTYGPDGLATLRDSAGHTATFGYDASGDLRTVTDQDGAVHRYDYDSTDRLTCYTSPAGAQTTYTYDSYDRLTRISLPDRTALKIAYHGNGYIPYSTTPVDSSGVDQATTRYSGDVDWAEVIKPAIARKVYFYDPYSLIVDLVQEGDAAAISATGSIPALDRGYTRGDTSLSVDVSAAQARGGIQLTELEIDGVEVDSVGAAPCDWSTCPTRARERLFHDPTFDPEGTYDYRVNTINGDNQRTDAPIWRIGIDRTGPSVSGMSAGAYLAEGETTAQVGWDGATDPALPDGTPGSGVGEYQYRFRRAGAAWGGWQMTAQQTFTLANSHDGELIDLEIRPFDRVGNAGALFATQVTVMVVPGDDAGPDLVLSGTLADRDGDYAGAGILGLEALAEDLDGSGVRSISIEGNGVVLDRFDADCTGGCPETQRAHLDIDTRLLPEGENTVVVTAIDAAGNRSADGQMVSILVDRSGPTAPSRVVLYDYNAGAQRVTLDWVEGRDPQLSEGIPGAGLRATEFRWRIRGGTWSTWRRVEGSRAALWGVRENDEVDVELRTVDMVGNMSGSTAVTLTVRRDPPPPEEAPRLAPDPGACTPQLDYARESNVSGDLDNFRTIETWLSAQLKVHCIIRDTTTHVIMRAQFAIPVEGEEPRRIGAVRTITFRPRTYFEVPVRGINAICMPNMAGHRDYIVVGRLEYVRESAGNYERDFWTDADHPETQGCPDARERRRREVASYRILSRFSWINSDGVPRSSAKQLRRALPEEPWAPGGVGRPWAAHHIVPTTDRRAQDMQALMFRCRVHPNSTPNGVFLRGDGLRKTLRTTGAPNPAYGLLRRRDEKQGTRLALRAYHPDTTRTAYVEALRAWFSDALRTHTERCPDGTGDVLRVLARAEQSLVAGEFDVGSPEN